MPSPSTTRASSRFPGIESTTGRRSRRPRVGGLPHPLRGRPRQRHRGGQPSNVFTLGGTTRNNKKGTATLKATVPNQGLTGSGKGVKAAGAKGAVISKTVTSPGQVQLLIKAKGTKKRKLNETGKVKLSVAATYTPTGGAPSRCH